jgi:hypothetical protein
MINILFNYNLFILKKKKKFKFRNKLAVLKEEMQDVKDYNIH